jgi:uncharacterized oligopeptide transporter (OPT) family protein
MAHKDMESATEHEFVESQKIENSRNEEDALDAVVSFKSWTTAVVSFVNLLCYLGQELLSLILADSTSSCRSVTVSVSGWFLCAPISALLCAQNWVTHP